MASEFEVGLAHKLLHVFDRLLFLGIRKEWFEVHGLGLLSALSHEVIWVCIPLVSNPKMAFQRPSSLVIPLVVSFLGAYARSFGRCSVGNRASPVVERCVGAAIGAKDVVDLVELLAVLLVLLLALGDPVQVRIAVLVVLR